MFSGYVPSLEIERIKTDMHFSDYRLSEQVSLKSAQYNLN